MITKTAIVGNVLSPLGVLPFQQDSKFLSIQDKMFSGEEYGNFLPNLWEFFRDRMVNYWNVEDTFMNSFANTTWSVISRTVDGIFNYQGISPLVEVNGSVLRGKCLRCNTVIDLCYADFEEMDDVPICPSCGKQRVRPDVVLAGEKLHQKRLAEDFVKDSEHVVFLGADYRDHNTQDWIRFAKNPLLVDTEIPEEYRKYPHIVVNTWEDWIEEGMPHKID